MDTEPQTVHKLKEQIVKFCDKITPGLKKPQKKFVREFTFGMQASKDVKLSNISRALKEHILLIKTENRLSRNLTCPDLDKILPQNILKLSKYKIQQDTVLALDLGDIKKEYAQKMENLTEVYNGSQHEKADGYWLLNILAAEIKEEELTPLFLKIFSQESPEFISENGEIISSINQVKGHIGNKGIWVIDRGGDRNILYKYFILGENKFAIRVRIDRDIIYNGCRKNILEVTKFCKNYSDIQVRINKENREEKKNLSVGEMGVFLPNFLYAELKLVIAKGFGEEPLLLLTNVLNKTKEEILEIYLTRWKCEESFRFIKQAYNLEDIRVRGWQSLKNLIVLVLAVFYFVCAELGKRLKLNILLRRIYQKAKRFFGIPSFKFYAVADGIYTLLFASLKGIDRFDFKYKTDKIQIPTLFPSQ
jgi:hypothetical protein